MQLNWFSLEHDHNAFYMLTFPSVNEEQFSNEHYVMIVLATATATITTTKTIKIITTMTTKRWQKEQSQNDCIFEESDRFVLVHIGIVSNTAMPLPFSLLIFVHRK